MIPVLGGCSLDSAGAGPKDRRDGGDAQVFGDCEDAGESRCEGDKLLTCQGGDLVVSATCNLGCAAAPTAHCAQIRPSFLDGVEGIWSGTGRILLPKPADGETLTYTVNGDTGVVSDQNGAMLRGDEEGIENGVFYMRVDGPEGSPGLALVSVKQLSVPKGVIIRVKGKRAVALIASEDIVVDGLVDLTALEETQGPGGEPGGASATQECDACGAPGGYDNSGVRAGGGGGANTGAGGKGGNHTVAAITAAGGAGGAAFELGDVLVGGGGGGAARGRNNNTTVFVRGGGGGGALLLVSQTSITINGTINAGGGGGSAQPFGSNTQDMGGGGGGGAGGTVLIESPVVTVTGVLAANGGGGGASKAAGSSNGIPGETGQATQTAASGGASVGAGAAGGNGSTANKGGNGGNGGDAAGGAGGGGGGAGRIRIAANEVSTEGATVSPALTTIELKVK